MRKTLAFTAALALLSGIPAAQAASSASATLDWSAFTIDFLKGSGSFTSAGSYTSASGQDYNAGGWSVWDTNAQSANLARAGASASAVANGTSLSASADAQYGTAGSGGAALFSNASFSGTATLDPGAVIEFTVPYALSATTDSTGTGGNWGSAGAGLSASTWLNGVYRNWSDSVGMYAGAGTPVVGDSGLLDLIIKNSSTTTQTLNFSAYTSATAATSFTAAVAPVPEPETYSMMMAGLGLLGFVTRKRKQAAA